VLLIGAETKLVEYWHGALGAALCW